MVESKAMVNIVFPSVYLTQQESHASVLSRKCPAPMKRLPDPNLKRAIDGQLEFAVEVGRNLKF